MKKIVCLICLFLSSCQSRTASSSNAESSFTSFECKEELKKEPLEMTGNLAALDEQDRKIMESTSPRTVDRIEKGESITISDIIKLSQAGVNDETILRYIHSTNTTYHLTQAQIRRLRQGGVSQRVIKYIFDLRSKK